MNIRTLSEKYSVSPQIAAEDAEAIRDAGIKAVICNRPDGEVPPTHQSDAIGAAIRAAGLEYHVLPITHQTMTPANVARQKELVDGTDGPVLAYCASGTRCSILWALSQVGTLDTDEILETAGRAGYDLAGMRPTLTALAQQA